MISWLTRHWPGCENMVYSFICYTSLTRVMGLMPPRRGTQRSLHPACTLLSTNLHHLLRELWRPLQTHEGKGGTETASPGRVPPLRPSYSLDQGVIAKHVFTSMLISVPLVVTTALKMYMAVSMTPTLRPSHLTPRLYQPQLSPKEVSHINKVRLV